MSKFYVEYQRVTSGRAMLPEGYNITEDYIKHKHGELNLYALSQLRNFITDFDRTEYVIKAVSGKVAGGFVITANEDMHLGRVACYICLWVNPKLKNNLEIAKLIKWYSDRFAKTFNCKYVAKVKHVSKSKRIETFREVK